MVNEPLYTYVNNPKSLTKGIKKVPLEQLKITHSSMLEMLDEFNKNLIKHQNALFLKSLINVFKPYAYSKLSKEQHNELMANLNDEMVVDALKNYEAVGIKEKIFIRLIKSKKVKMLLFLIKIMG